MRELWNSIMQQKWSIINPNLVTTPGKTTTTKDIDFIWRDLGSTTRALLWLIGWHGGIPRREETATHHHSSVSPGLLRAEH